MHLERLVSNRSRLSVRLEEKEKNNSKPLYSHQSLISNIDVDEHDRRYQSLLQFLRNSRSQNFSRILSSSSRTIEAPSSKKLITYGVTTSSAIDHKIVNQIITQQTADQLALILGNTKLPKAKLYEYYPPEERFTRKPEYTLEKDKPLKTEEDKMLKVQQLIKAKIDELILFLYSILKDTSEEMRNERKFKTLKRALENIYKAKSDDLTVLNMKANEVCAQLFHDIRRIDIEVERLLEGNRAIAFGFLSAKDIVYCIFFINLKQLDYMQKWEKSRRWLQRYYCKKECSKISEYIRETEDKIAKDEVVTEQITAFLNLDIQELEQKRDEYPDKLDQECDWRNRVITQLKDELEKMQIHRKALAKEIEVRTTKMNEWKIYRTIKEAEDAELERIAAEEEQARLEEEERIAAELAAEEELLATFTLNERLQYFKNKKKQQRRAAKAAKAAAKAALRKQRRKA